MSSFLKKISPLRTKKKDDKGGTTTTPSPRFKQKRGSRLFSSREKVDLGLPKMGMGNISKGTDLAKIFGGETKREGALITDSEFKEWDQDNLLNWVERIGFKNTTITEKINHLEIDSCEELEETITNEEDLFFADLTEEQKKIFLFHFGLIKYFSKYSDFYNVLIQKFQEKKDFLTIPIEDMLNFLCETMIDEDELFRRLVTDNIDNDKEKITIRVVLMNESFFPTESIRNVLMLDAAFRKEEGEKKKKKNNVLHSFPSLIGKLTTGIVFENVYLEWNKSGFIVPFKVPYSSSFGFELGKVVVSVDDLECDQLIKTIFKYIVQNDYDDKACNSQMFIDELISKNVLSEDWFYDPVCDLRFLKELRGRGRVYEFGFEKDGKMSETWTIDDVYMFMKYLPFAIEENKQDCLFVRKKFEEIKLTGAIFKKVNEERLLSKFTIFKNNKNEEEEEGNEFERVLNLRLKREMVVSCIKVCKILDEFKREYFPFIKKMILRKYEDIEKGLHFGELVKECELDYLFVDAVLSKTIRKCSYKKSFVDLYLAKEDIKKVSLCIFEDSIQFDDFVKELSFGKPIYMKRGMKEDCDDDEDNIGIVEFTKMKLHCGILINNKLFVEWRSDSIVIPSQIDDILSEKHLSDCQIFEIDLIRDGGKFETQTQLLLKERLASMITNWNLYRRFDQENFNAQKFVNTIIFDIIKYKKRHLPKFVRKLFERFDKEGSIDLSIELSSKFLKLFKMNEKKLKNYVIDNPKSKDLIVQFFSHKNLDEFISLLKENYGGKSIFENVINKKSTILHEFKLLKIFDMCFWLRFEDEFEEDKKEKYKPYNCILKIC